MRQKLESNFRGIVGVYKPVGPSSHMMINRIRRVTGERRVGHAGTLDPLAEGVLVVGIGREATRKLASQVKKEKEYVTEIRLGVVSSTDDRGGEMVKREKIEQPNEAKVREVVDEFVGEIWQTPPKFSAVKVKGKEAYKRMRQGEEVELAARLRVIEEIEVMGFEWPMVKLKVVTGPGVYIRSLARDIGERLGTGGMMESLIRTAVGEFRIDECVEVNEE